MSIESIFRDFSTIPTAARRYIGKLAHGLDYTTSHAAIPEPVGPRSAPDPDQQPASARWTPPAIGQPFNPSYRICGFYPPECVRRRKDLTQAQKLLYLTCAHWAGDKGTFWRGFDSMAHELGYSIRQVQRDMRKLESTGLIAHVRRGRGQTNRYQFLWHKIFEDDLPNTAGQSPANPSSSRDGVKIG